MEIMNMLRDIRGGWIGAALATVVVALGACSTAEADDAQADPAEFARVINVEVRPLETERFVEEIRLTSVALANQDVQVSAEESGVIRQLFVDRGDVVNEGDPIAKIDDRVLSAQVAQARAAAELAEQTWQRRKRLWEEDRVGSEIAYLEARFGAEQSAASLDALEQRLARTVIRAPFQGVLDDRFVDVGAMVSPGDPVARLVDLTPIKVAAGVPERYARDVRVGEEATVEFPALNGQPHTARIRYVGSTVDPQNRTFRIEVEIANPNRLIKPQMVANMAVTRQAVSEAIVVPQDALVRVANGYVVYVLAERNGATVAEARGVTLGPARRNRVVVEQGVMVGEQLIVVGHRSVADGDRVNVVERGE
jgi:membrane fusion protein, multidrug efflux system